MEAQTIKGEARKPVSVKAARPQGSKLTDVAHAQDLKVTSSTLTQQRVIDVLTQPVAGMQRVAPGWQDSSVARPARPQTKTEPAQLNKENWAQRRLLTTVIRAKKAWQTVAILSILCLIAASAAAGWLFLDRQTFIGQQTHFLNRVQYEHNQLVQRLSSENEKLIAENAALKNQNNLLPSSITPAETLTRK